MINYMTIHEKTRLIAHFTSLQETTHYPSTKYNILLGITLQCSDTLSIQKVLDSAESN